MDESNATCGKSLASIGLDNTEANRQAHRTLLVTAPGLGNYLYQSTVDGKKMGLVPPLGSHDESWCQSLDGLASRTAAYHQQGARFAKWRTVVSIPNGPSALVVKEAACLGSCSPLPLHRTMVLSQLWSQRSSWMAITGSNAPSRWPRRSGLRSSSYYMAENNVMFEGILLKPSMVTPGAECKQKATPKQVAEYTLKLLHRRIPPSVPGIMASVPFL
ncbi:putative Fructose-bisphosphate aldolase, chloroplastic [Cocos nucifera]|uniref:Fructose-bisphosphate aldolase n=1 Tax=Cocos nucifera TaxID=13894 RepID=A0A8K0N8A5_COCNU|nr:putative Fructose-bisphosphate aldolase, chloroplastic [Cocos nucifera]KAG1362232.1 putative Fructose-bisphosphate aldolase, chloroplastic [Cocos nucifera]